MKFSVSAGSAALAAAQSIANPDELAYLLVEGSLLSVDLTGMDYDAAMNELKNMEQFVGGKIADSDAPEVITALGSLKATIAGFATDLVRERIIQERKMTANDNADATLDATGSHPLPSGDATISTVSQQSSNANENEEISSEAQTEGRAGGRGRR